MPPILEKFDTFCGDSDQSMGDIFSRNLSNFLGVYAGEIANTACVIEGMPNLRVWATVLELHPRSRPRVILYILQEDCSISTQSCHHCRYAGWSKHSVPNRTYHFVISKRDEEEVTLDQSLLDLTNCRLYGLIHSDGYGHLLYVSGNCGNSESPRGAEIMDLWNRICTKLGAWNVSVRDMSTKHSMDLRLLLGVAFNDSWFVTKWGYKFSHGKFGVTKEQYRIAINSIAALSLKEVIQKFDVIEEKEIVEGIFKYYKSCCNDRELKTLKDLLQYMLTIRDGKSIKERRYLAAVAKSSELLASEIAIAAQVVDTLIEKGPMNRTELQKEPALKSLIQAGDNLKDILMALDGKRINNSIVTIEKMGRSYQFRVEDVGGPGSNIYSDIIAIYNHVLASFPGSYSVIHGYFETVLNGIHFIKSYPPTVHDKHAFVCFSVPHDNMDIFMYNEIMVVVTSPATVGKVKQGARDLIKEMYCTCNTDHFIVEAIQGFDNDDTMLPLDENGLRLGLQWNWTSSGISCLTTTYQGGPSSRENVVKCKKCGAKQDDGEAMAQCLRCKVWHHKECLKVEQDTMIECLGCMPTAESALYSDDTA